MIHHEIFPERIVGFNNLWIHFISREFNCVSMSIIPCSLIQMESWARFLGDVFFPLPEEIEYSFLLYFGIVQIWLKGFEWEGLVCDYLFNSQRESHSVLDMDFFLLLYLHLFCSIWTSILMEILIISFVLFNQFYFYMHQPMLKAWLFEKLIFELGASSYSLKVTCMLLWQVIFFSIIIRNG